MIKELDKITEWFFFVDLKPWQILKSNLFIWKKLAIFENLDGVAQNLAYYAHFKFEIKIPKYESINFAARDFCFWI